MPIPRERHPEYYFKDGTVFFLVLESTQHTLYRLYPGLLALRSSVFDSLLSLPLQENQENPEGKCDANPIILHGIVRREFDYLLAFLFGSYVEDEQREEFLISLLKLSTFFEINDGLRYAVMELSRMSPSDPSLKIQLGRQYRVDHWVDSSFRNLMSRPLSSISHLEARRMGLDYFYILAHTKALIEEDYRAIAYTEPDPIQSPGCMTPAECAATWRDEWWNGVARQLLHPETPCRGHELVSMLEDVDIPGLCTACKQATLAKIKESDALQHEKTLHDIALLQVMELQTDEHIRAAFRLGGSPLAISSL